MTILTVAAFPSRLSRYRRWTYLYRAVDKEGKTVDFLLRAKRAVAAAKAFFRLAFRRQGRLPHKITLDGYQAAHRAAKEALGL